MPFPTNMVYIRWEFQWSPVGGAGATEIQNFGIWAEVKDPIQPPFPGWNNVCNDGAQIAANAWKVNMEPGRFANPVLFQRAVVYHYDQGHEQALDRGESGGTQGPEVWRGAGNATLPPQSTIAVSLYGFEPGTYQFQPGRHRGRIYLPTSTRQMLGDDGTLDPTNRELLRGDLLNFFDDLVSEFDTVSFTPMISSVTGQIATPITWFRIGSVMDTQRRRRNRLPENYLNTPLTD
uniref:Uncharacterized protein n=1 Tax=uncultured prokaryote TaxID=198431 RepID=A0A0H5QNL3_9ZZZZ|nr:hypothetical protein [uncultured prokaryote]